MLTLEAALASGRSFRKVGTTGGYAIPTSFVAADITAKYELSPEVAKSIVLSQLAAAWDASTPASGSVASSAESTMFKKLVQRLGF